MPDQKIRIRFEPGGHTALVQPGDSLLEAAARAGLILNTPCGGAGTCGKCRVRFTGRAPSPVEADLLHIGEADLRSGWRLGCRVRFFEDSEVWIPTGSLLGGEHQIQTESRTGNHFQAEANIQKTFLSMAPPVLEDNVADLARIERALKEHRVLEDADGILDTPPAVLTVLGHRLRKAGFAGTATVRGNTLIHFEKGDTTGDACAAAFDIGTTTLVGSLMRLDSGEEVALATAVNPQTAFGDDVLSRIAYASRDAAALAEIRGCLVDQLRVMVREMCAEAGIAAEHIYAAACAGNTTMEHLLAGISPAPLGVVPFVPAFARGLSLPETDFNLGIHPQSLVYVFPVIGGFVGGDTVAGMVAADLYGLDGPVLMLDIGTNGEIVLVHEGRIYAASTAAGPAFEGARISSGMRASAGAVEKVLIGEDIELGVIGGAAPRGICGSGLIDLCGQLLKAGLLTHDGRLLTDTELPESTPQALRQRMRRNREGVPECLIAGSGDQTVLLTQQDVRELQLGAGAIRAGIAILLRQAGLTPGDLRQILIAGGFGSFIRRDNAQRIGLIPHEVSHDKIRFVGNTAFSGAKWAAVSGAARREAERLARLTVHVELSQDPDFALEFAMAMRFPDEESGV